MDIVTYLKEHNIKPSYSRIRILDYMMTHKNHPTVDMIYGNLVKEMPTLSKTTVYNTMELFLNSGVVKLISIDEKEKRYDADISTHGHFRCDNCGRIVDLYFDGPLPMPKAHEDLEIREIQYYAKGLCKHCK